MAWRVTDWSLRARRAAALKLAGLDWPVQLRPLSTTLEDADETRVLIPSHRAVVRGDNGLVLGVVGADFGGCTTDDSGAVVCDFSKDGTTWVVAWSEGADAPYTVPEGARLVCDPLANCQEVEAGAQVTLTEIPVRFYQQ
jgi:hypothetical protein